MTFIAKTTRRGIPRPALCIAFILAAISAQIVSAQSDIRFDAFALPRFVLSGDGLAPVLPHGGFALGGGAELHTGIWIPARVQIEYFHVFPSAVSSAGDLYRSWAGWELSLAAGARAFEKDGGRPFALDVLGGASFGADKYPGTNVAFASFSIDALVRADFAAANRGGLRVFLPLSYVFRPGARSFIAGLGVGWGFAPLPMDKPGTAAEGKDDEVATTEEGAS